MSKVKATTGKAKYRTDITAGMHHFLADEPVDLGGRDFGPTPTQYMAAALASCSSMTMKMYADRKEWDMESATAEVDYKRDRESGVTTFTKKITIIGNLDEAQRKRIFEIASRCPVHRMIQGTVEIESELSEG